MMSKKVKAELSVELSEARVCDDAEPPAPDAPRASAAMLFAATNWICGLELPRRAEGLWADPRLADRSHVSA